MDCPLLTDPYPSQLPYLFSDPLSLDDWVVEVRPEGIGIGKNNNVKNNTIQHDTTRYTTI